MIGQTIGHYQITAKLGAGGMGEVYLADDTKLDRQVALKFLPSALWNEDGAQKRLIREAKAASKLDHPNIVTIHGIEEFDGQPFIIMAYVPGATLREYCAAESRTIEELVDVAIQIADGLQHAHDAGVIHRDLKPSNVLVDQTGRTRVLDFGIATLRGAAKLTQTGTAVGTLAYAAPELVMDKDAETTSDIYSLGVVLYEMLTGRLPFEAAHEAALVYSIVNESPTPIPEDGAPIPAALQALVMRCLEKDPHKRYENCARLAGELRRFQAGLVSELPGNDRTRKPSIAVLPFTNMSADPENEYFSDGLTEELLNVLAKNPQLQVTGRTSCFAFKGKNVDLRKIGQELGVETILEGSVRKAGNRVRITTQLVKASDGFHLWSETYDRVLDDIFAVQDDIAQAVSKAMHVTLLGKTAPGKKVNPESYKLVLQGNYYAARNTSTSLAQAVNMYEQALAIESNDAHAWAGLAIAYGMQAQFGTTQSYSVATPKAKRAAARALELDSELADAHDVTGWMAMSFDFEWEKAGLHLRRAHELAPSDARILYHLANYEALCERTQEALRLAEKAVTIDPLNPMAHFVLGRMRITAGQYDDAYASYSRALELSPGMTSANVMKGAIRILQERYDEALEEAKKEQSTGYRSCSLAMIYHSLGDREKSDEQLSILLGEGEQWEIQIALVHAYRGEVDLAFAALDRAYEVHDNGIVQAKSHPVFASLHDDPRWPEFLRKIGLDK